MKILLNTELTEEGYLATIDKLPDFKATFSKSGDEFGALPSALKTFVTNWESETKKKTTKYQKEFPAIQRIKSRSFYQASTYRIQEVINHKEPKKLDLELLHSLNQNDFVYMFTSNKR